ncbi:MAG: septum formation initiator family protein [Chloroflexi bacterium]|nr:septum formation initiator family protein [Chloroflexota bacterium]
MPTATRSDSPSLAQLLSVLACTLVIFFVISFVGKAIEAYQLQRQVSLLEAQVKALEKEGAALEDQLEYVRSDAYVEKVVREQLKWSRPGETVFLPLPRLANRTQASPLPTTPAGPALVTTPQWQSHWPEWWALLFGSR